MLKGAVIGTGFWSQYQVAAWNELNGVKIVAVYNRTKSKAEEIAKRFSVANVYDDIDALFQETEIDFADIITDVDTHHTFTIKAAEKGIDVICQKPMASSVQQAREMVAFCEEKSSRLFIHENFRWQAPIRRVKAELNKGTIGDPFKARVSFCSAFPVFENQPFLAEVDHFILMDIGSHVLDICRFLFGEVKGLSCLTHKVNSKIKGEDVANVLMEMESGVHCFAEMSYASILERESFPQTLVLVEGTEGSIHLSNDFKLTITTRGESVSTVVQPRMYSWLDPAYAVVHSSIVDCNRNILKGLMGGQCETTGEDNLKTVELVWACYESAARRKPVSPNHA